MASAPGRRTLTAEPDHSALAQAVGLALAVLRDAKVRSFAELQGCIPARLDLTDEQIELINAHLPVVGVIRWGTRAGAGRPATATVTAYVCPKCDRWGLIGATQAPASCALTPGCAGKPVKAKVATLDKPPPPPKPKDG